MSDLNVSTPEVSEPALGIAVTSEAEYFVVTNTNSSGDGSLVAALEQAAAYTGELPICILIDETLSGQTIELDAELAVYKPLSIVHRGQSPVCIQTESMIRCSADMELQNLVISSLMMGEGTILKGSGNVITKALYVSSDADLSQFQADGASEDSVVYLYGGFSAGTGYSYAALGENLGRYRLSSSSTLSEGTEVLVHRGASLGLSESDMVLTVAAGGKLTVEGE